MNGSIEFHRQGEWTAVYLDGELQRVGDHYLANEWLQERCGVKVVDDDAFMLGDPFGKCIATSLEEVENYRRYREERRREAAILRERADAMIRDAEKLESL